MHNKEFSEIPHGPAGVGEILKDERHAFEYLLLDSHNQGKLDADVSQNSQVTEKDEILSKNEATNSRFSPDVDFTLTDLFTTVGYKEDVFGNDSGCCPHKHVSGDWKESSTTWKTNGTVEFDKNFGDSTTKLKYKNLYSISTTNRCKRHCYCSDSSIDRDVFQNTAEKQKAQSTLQRIREYLANFQETYGTPRTEYSFATLVKVMGEATGRSFLALLYIVMNIAPVVQVFLHILRFIIDKAINIHNTSDNRQMFVKYILLAVQLFYIYIALFFIFGYIVLPIIFVIIEIITKMLMYS